MHPRSTAFLFLLVMAAPGCMQKAPQDVGPTAPPAELQAPWWPVGTYWDVEIRRPAVPMQALRLVNFWNDTATNHFWLGVADRSVALDHALHDTLPILGRIHWGLLTPHESGMHAHGLYTFPVAAGEEFEGISFGREWKIQTAAIGSPESGKLSFAGTSPDGAKISYDYDARSMWFTFLEVKGPSGMQELRIDVKGHGRDAHGTFYFLRGRDYYLGPTDTGTHDETFCVPESAACADVPKEDDPLKTLALEIKGKATDLLRIEIKSPTGELRHSETLARETVHTVRELDNPVQGEWTISFIGTGAFEGTIEVVGCIEFGRTI